MQIEQGVGMLYSTTFITLLLLQTIIKNMSYYQRVKAMVLPFGPITSYATLGCSSIMMVGFVASLSHLVVTDTALLLLFAEPQECIVDTFLLALAVTGSFRISVWVLVYSLDIVYLPFA